MKVHLGAVFLRYSMRLSWNGRDGDAGHVKRPVTCSIVRVRSCVMSGVLDAGFVLVHDLQTTGKTRSRGFREEGAHLSKSRDKFMSESFNCTRWLARWGRSKPNTYSSPVTE